MRATPLSLTATGTFSQLIPSGILRPGKKAAIGAGTVVDPAALVVELENLKKSGIEVRGRLFLSNRAHLIFPYHREMDKAAEIGAWRGEENRNYFARHRSGI